MRPLRDVRLSPLAWLAIAAAVAALLRFAVALLVVSPLYYPDEYLNTAVSRGIGDGTFGQIRGGAGPPFGGFTSYFAPLLQAPIWQLDDVDVAYRLVQALGAVAVASAAFPAYALARQVGVSARGALVAGLLALTVPAAAFSVTILSEPYAYSLFLVAVLLAVRALERETLGRHLAAVGAAVGLCFVGGLQFAFVAPAYAAVWCILPWRTPRVMLMRLAVAVAAVAAALGAALAVGRRDYLDLLLNALTREDWGSRDLVGWFAANTLVLAIAAGWVVLPGAVGGLRGLARSAVAGRAFAALCVLLILAMLVEAALWGARDQGVYERFFFYAAPLLAVAFVWSAEHAALRRRGYAVVAYLAVLAAVLLPITDPLFAALDDHSPTLLGLTRLAYGTDVGGGIWAPMLALLAFATAWRGLAHPRAVTVVALAVGVITSLGASIVFVERARSTAHPPHLGLPEGTALITWEGTSKALLGESLFWNPEITRVVIFGPGIAPDLLPFTRAELASPGRLVDGNGRPLVGPYAISADTVAVGGGATGRERDVLIQLRRPPSLLAFGWYRSLGYLGFGGLLFATSPDGTTRVGIRVRSSQDRMTVGFRCDGGFEREVVVGRRARTIAIPLPPNGARSCRFAVLGTFQRVGGRLVSVEAELVGGS